MSQEIIYRVVLTHYLEYIPFNTFSEFFNVYYNVMQFKPLKLVFFLCQRKNLKSDGRFRGKLWTNDSTQHLNSLSWNEIYVHLINKCFFNAYSLPSSNLGMGLQRGIRWKKLSSLWTLNCGRKGRQWTIIKIIKTQNDIRKWERKFSINIKVDWYVMSEDGTHPEGDIWKENDNH